MFKCKKIFNTHWCCCIISLVLSFRKVICLVKENEFFEIEELPMPDLFVYPSMGFKLILPVLREEVLNVSFFGNINRIRNRETKDFEKHLTGNFQNLTVQWVYENDTFVFKNSDTFYAWIGFLMRDGNTFWDVREYEIWYWRLHSLGVSTTTDTTTDLDDGMFDIFEPNLAKLHPELKKMLIPTSKTRRNSFSPKRYVTFSAQKVTKLKTWKEKETNTNENSWSV